MDDPIEAGCDDARGAGIGLGDGADWTAAPRIGSGWGREIGSSFGLFHTGLPPGILVWNVTRSTHSANPVWWRITHFRGVGPV